MEDFINPLTLIDGYKTDHRRQYPDGTEYVYSNWTPRSSRVEGVKRVTFFGLQYFLEKYLNQVWGQFFKSDIEESVKYFNQRMNSYLGPNSIGDQHIRDLHKLGYLPLEICAVPEGTSVPLRMPMLTIENTHKDFAWIVNYLETLISNVLWMPCTSVTNAGRMKRMLLRRAEETGGSPDFVKWQGHDFSFRGMAGLEAACLSGAAHLVHFLGTDTLPAIDFIERYYPTANPIGGSVAATEHSVMCAGGEEGELETISRLLDLYPSGILSVVSDTWDLWHVLTSILPKLRDRIMKRNGTLVIRPDSGDPVKILCGDPDAEFFAAKIGVVQLLWNVFGGTVNEKGYQQLDSHIGAIYGDSINYDRAYEITTRLADKGFASTNVVLGMGSYGYQYQTRDTFGFAKKATWVQINGEGKPIFKKPKTDNGVKNSAKGRLAIVPDQNGAYVLHENVDKDSPLEVSSVLQPVWRNGDLLRRTTFDEVRENAQREYDQGLFS